MVFCVEIRRRNIILSFGHFHLSGILVRQFVSFFLEILWHACARQSTFTDLSTGPWNKYRYPNYVLSFQILPWPPCARLSLPKTWNSPKDYLDTVGSIFATFLERLLFGSALLWASSKRLRIFFFFFCQNTLFNTQRDVCFVREPATTLDNNDTHYVSGASQI